MYAFLTSLADRSPALLGIGASVLASFGTGLGALPVFVIPTVTQRAQDVMMSIGAGIMLSAASFSLVEPGYHAAALQTGGAVSGAALIAASIALGAISVLFVHRNAPHEHLVTGRKGGPVNRRGLQRAWLFVIAMALHHFPEGLAVGVGFGGHDVGNGLSILAAVFLQNLPEGFVVAVALLALGYRRRFAFAVAAGTGFFETLGGVLGAVAVSVVTAALPLSMGFAAGAMLFVVSHEIIPETHRNGYETEATFGVVGGFTGMLLLEAALG